MRNIRRWLLATALLIAVACGVEIGVHHLVGGNTPVLTEHRPLQASGASKELGEDCAQHGETECRSRFCLHVSPDRNAGYFCSRSCATSQDCPLDWSCAQIYPSAQASACVPPPNWASKLAAVRPQSSRSIRP